MALSAACSSIPGLQDPTIQLSPRYYLYKLRGDARMQSVSGGSIVENGSMSISQLGQSKRDDDYGGVLSIGDGFSGIEAEYQRVDMDDTSTGVLTADYGFIPTGTIVSSAFKMDEYRLTYTAELLDHEFEIGEDEFLRVRAGPSAAIAHREGTFSVFEDGNSVLNQGLKFKDDGVPYIGLRGRVEWREFSAQIDWDYNPDITFGGDFEGELHDIEILARYEFEAQDISVLAGYRWSDIQTSGPSGDLRYDMDFKLEGYVLGIEFRF